MSGQRTLRKAKLTIEYMEDSGDWAWLEDLEELVESAAAEIAVEPSVKLKPSGVTIVLSSDASVADLNGRFRGKAKPTNVLSFPAGPGANEDHIGDIVLANETILREAQELDVPPEHHFQHLVVHGILHLLGFDHETDREAEKMEALEIKILGRLGVANPYTEPLDTDKRV